MTVERIVAEGETATHTTTATDGSSRGGRTNPGRWLVDAVAIGLAVVVCLAAPHPRYRRGIATNDVAAVQNLKALATAQAQYIKKRDAYAASGRELNARGTLIAADLAHAFEEWQFNGDVAPGQVQPKAGYLYRLLQGDSHGPTSYYKDAHDATVGMNTWAAICRAAAPGVSGEDQFFITEAGTVYKHAEPPAGSPQYATFLLDTVPAIYTADGALDEAGLAARGWTRVK